MYSDNFYYIVFTKGVNHWWSRFIHPSINHCYLMRPDRGRIIIFEKGLAEVSVYTIDEIDDKIGNNRLLRWNKAESGQGLFMLNTCVGHIKQLLGINRPFIWTPYQLYKYIGLQNGLFEKSKETAAFSAGTSSNHATDSRARQGSRGTGRATQGDGKEKARQCIAAWWRSA